MACTNTSPHNFMALLHVSATFTLISIIQNLSLLDYHPHRNAYAIQIYIIKKICSILIINDQALNMNFNYTHLGKKGWGMGTNAQLLRHLKFYYHFKHTY